MQELLDDIKALRRGIEALNKRSLEQGQPISRAEVDEVLAIVKKGTTVSVDYKALAQHLQPHLATPATIEAAVATGSQQLAQVIDRIPRSVPLQDAVWGFTSVYAFLGVSLILVGFFAWSGYSWREKGAAEAKTELLEQQLTQKQASLDRLTKGYLDLQRDNPKAAKKYFF